MLLRRPGFGGRGERTRVGAVRLFPGSRMFHRVSLKTILIGGAVLAAVIPAVLVGIALVSSLHDSAIQEATARYELLGPGPRLGARPVPHLAPASGPDADTPRGGPALPRRRRRRAAPRPNQGQLPRVRGHRDPRSVGPHRRVGSPDDRGRPEHDRASTCPTGEWFRELVREPPGLSCTPTSRSARSDRAASVSRSARRSRTDPADSGERSPPGSGSTPFRPSPTGSASATRGMRS